MKKFVSVILSLTFVLGLISVIPTNAAENNTDDIQSFVNESMELLSYETEPVYSSESVDEETTKIDFSSCRLILKATKEPEKLNSVGIADGFKDYYIVQFKNEIDAKKAYEYYSNKDYIKGVDVDVAQNALTSTNSLNSIDFKNKLNGDSNLMAADVPTYDGVPDRLNSWGSEAVGAYAVKDYLSSNEDIQKNEVIVAVVDSGIEFSHEYFSDKQDRLERTNFTTVTEKSTDESDLYGHGTAVTSVILDSAPDNVVVRNYKVTDDGNMTMTDVATAIFQAVLDGVDIINCSFAFPGIKALYAEYEFLEDCIEETYKDNVLIVCSAGNYINESLQPYQTLPATSEYALSITGLQQNLDPTFSQGWTVDVSAPGVDIPCAYKGSYRYGSGTSFSSPLTASVCASMLILNPQLTPEDIIDKIKETSTPYDDVVNLDGHNNVYGTGFVDAVEATGIERPKKIIPNVKAGKHTDEITLNFTAPDGGNIYYTYDGSYPTAQTGYIYTEPLKLYADQYIIKAVYYDEKGIPSPLFAEVYRSSILEDESKFEIDKNGALTKYNGTLCDIIIPETVNGIEVKNIAQSAFADTVVTGITLPKTITTLGYFDYEHKGSFYGNKSLIFIDGESVEKIGHDVFNDCTTLGFVNFPNCTELGDGVFIGINTMNQLDLPKVKRIGIQCIYACYILFLNLPELESCAEESLSICRFYDIYIPKLSRIEDEEIIKDSNILYRTGIYSPLDLKDAETLRRYIWKCADDYVNYRVEFSKIKALYDLPGYFSTLVLPSTLEILPENVDKYYGEIKHTYTIYGSKGTLVEKWANENKITFIEITPETAVIEDLPKYYKPYMGNLVAGVVGFNREYQWYANDVNSNEGGTPIEGATEKSFDPATYPDAKYYYCEVISQDVGYEPITIKTSACENRMNVAVEEEKSCITSVTYEPSREYKNTFTVTAEGRPMKIQFIEPYGGTRTYDRNHKNVTIKSYDENGNEVTSLDRALSYEVWEICSNMAVGVEIKTKAKCFNGTSTEWEDMTYNFTVEFLPLDTSIRSITPAATSGPLGGIETKVVTGPDVQGIRFVMPNETTCTYYSSGAAVLDNGDLEFTGRFWIGDLGLNVVKVLVRSENKWTEVDTIEYMAE